MMKLLCMNSYSEPKLPPVTKSRNLAGRLRKRRRRNFFRSSRVIRTMFKNIGPEQRNLLEKVDSRIGDYEIGTRLGEGSYGTVFLGRSTNEKKVAIKVFEKDKIELLEHLMFVDTEIGILQKHGHHPNIIGFEAKLHAKKNIYLVMEKATMSLADLMYDTNVFQVQEDALQQVVRGILQGLQYLHEHGIVHRDIKPENVLIITDAVDMKKNRLIPGRRIEASSVRLCDFGLSVVAESQDKPYGAARLKPSVHVMMGFAGTPSYMAPETLNRLGYDGCAADLFSVGCILVRMRLQPDLLYQWDGLYDAMMRTPDFFEHRICNFINFLNPKQEKWNGRCDNSAIIPAEPCMFFFINKEKCEQTLLHELMFMGLVTVDPTLRLSASQTLKHPWLNYYQRG